MGETSATVFHDQIGLRLAESARRWRQLLDERLRDSGLSQARWLALLHLRRLGDGIAQIALAQSIGIEGASLVRILDDLEARRLVERRTDPQDRRAKHLLLTAEGLLALNEVDAIARALRREMLAGLDQQQITEFQDVLDRILANADQLSTKPRHSPRIEKPQP